MDHDNKKIGRNEVQAILDEGVYEGYVELDTIGRYQLTAEGERKIAVITLLELFDQRQDAAYTFGALVSATGFEVDSIVKGLTTLINDKVIHFGMVAGPKREYIFYLCAHSGELQMFLGKDESPGDGKYDAYVTQLLKKLFPADMITIWGE